MKRSLRRILSAVLICAGLLTFCGCGESAEQPPENSPIATQSPGTVLSNVEVLSINWARVADAPLGAKALEFLLRNFGLRITETHIPTQQLSERVFQLFAGNVEVDLLSGIKITDAQTLGRQGYLLDFSQEWNNLSQYRRLWDSWSEGWQYTLDIIETDYISGEGEEAQAKTGVFCLVPVNRKTSLGWIYSKTAFEEMECDFPETLDELYNVLTKYKSENKLSTPWTSRYEPLQKTAILNAYGLTEDEWQFDASGNLFYLYSRQESFQALEWLEKFASAGLVPVDEEGEVSAYATDAEYVAAAQEATQILEFTQVYQQYSIESYQAEKNPLVEWETAPAMVKAQGYTPALQANTPYINEATCIAAASDRTQQERILQLLDWLCSNEGNLWANFGQQGVGYTVENNQFQFLLYYDEEMTPNLDPSDGTIADITVGRMFTTAPWQSTGLENRYTEADQFAQNSGARIVLPAVLGNASAAVEDNTQLWRLDSIAEELNALAMEFAETVKKDGFTAAGWTEYYQKLQQAGLSEYTQFMQKRAG